jgi:hypothetical protein
MVLFFSWSACDFLTCGVLLVGDAMGGRRGRRGNDESGNVFAYIRPKQPSDRWRCLLCLYVLIVVGCIVVVCRIVVP